MASISTLVDRVKLFVNSSGTGPFVLGAAVPAFRGVEALADGFTYSYAVENGSNYEAGTGEYVASSNSILRTPTISSQGGAPVAFPAGVQIAFTALAQDLIASGGDLSLRPQLATASGAEMVGINDGAAGALYGDVQGAVDFVRGEIPDLIPSSGATLVGSDDGDGGTLWTTVAGFIAYLRSSAGSAIVGFLQAGVGAQARTMQAKARDVLNAADFGVVAAPSWAGSSDQTAKLQAAINRAKATWRDLVLPPGIIRVDGALDCTGMFAGGLKIKGVAKGSPNAGTGTVIMANTGGVVFDFTGSQYCELEDVVIDGLVFSPPTPSTVGILYARATTSAYAQFNGLKNVHVRLPSDMAANGGNGSYGLLNVASEIHDYHNLACDADNPVACLSDKPAWLSSPFKTIETGITSMSVIAFTGYTSLTGLNATRPAFKGLNLKACSFDMLYTVGDGTHAFDLDGCENIAVKAGSLEGHNFKIAKLFNVKNIEFNVYIAGATTASPIEMPAAFGSVRGLTLRTECKSSWDYIIESAGVGSVVEGMNLFLTLDDGTVPATNMPNTSNVVRFVTTGLSTGGAFQLDMLKGRVVDYLRFAPIAAASAVNASLFHDTATGKISWKDGTGAVTPLY